MSVAKGLAGRLINIGLALVLFSIASLAHNKFSTGPHEAFTQLNKVRIQVIQVTKKTLLVALSLSIQPLACHH